MGPVVGVLGALQAQLCLRVLLEDPSVFDSMYAYRALDRGLRRVALPESPDCPLCTGEIRDMDLSRYLPPECAA